MPDTENTDSINHTQKILQQLRNDFLADLPDRYSSIEDRILSLQKSSSPGQDFDDLYRNVHSLKGSAGTFGVEIVTTICHHLEDHLNLLDDDFSNIDDEYIDACLAYVDLVKQAYNLAINDDSNSTPIRETLKTLRKESLKNNYSCLIVTGSNLMDIVCQNALQDMPVQPGLATDGLSALDKLMHEKFDFVIMSNEISGLNGTAITYALRASRSINQNATVIMITSKDKSNFVQKLAPDYVIKKDQNLSENITKAVHLITTTPAKASHAKLN